MVNRNTKAQIYLGRPKDYHMDSTRPSAAPQSPESEGRKAGRQCKTSGLSGALHTLDKGKKLGVLCPATGIHPHCCLEGVKRQLRSESTQALEGADEPLGSQDIFF